MHFNTIRRHIGHFMMAGLSAKRSKDLLCEYGYNSFVMTDDTIELHFRWNTKIPKEGNKNNLLSGNKPCRIELYQIIILF